MSGWTKRALVVAIVGCVAAVVFGHAVWMSGYLRRTSDIVFTSSAGPTERAQLQQGFSLDGMMWIEHAIELGDRAGGRVRFTDFDNPPNGREVHWSSGWAWWLRGLGLLRAGFTGEPPAAAIERAAVWANLPVLIAGMIVLSAWVARRWGWGAGCLLLLGMGLHRDFYEAFHPGNPDHHGVIALCVLGMVIGLLLSGAGWWSRDIRRAARLLPDGERSALRSASFSAVWGGIGLWVSAASLVVPLALVGITAVGASWLLSAKLREAGVSFSAQVWRRWGRVGAATSLAFYFLEYFPRFPLSRFEVNHPLYAAGWWAGAELAAALIVWRARDRAAPARRDIWGGGCGLGVLVAAGLVFVVFREQGFTFMQPFMARLYRHVDELRPLWAAIARDGLWNHVDHAVIYLAPLAIAPLFLARRGVAPEAKLLLALVLAVAGALTAQGWWQTRWLLVAGAGQVLVMVVWVGLVLARSSLGPRGWSAVVCVCVAFYGAGPWLLGSQAAKTDRLRDVRMDECLQLFYRDVAQRLVAEGGGARVVLLGSPNASLSAAYYGDFKAVGTLYWENHDGLTRAARIWTARTEEEAEGLLREAGVTHVLVSWPHDFHAEYHDALRPPWGLGETFAERLKTFRLPRWLRPVDYSPPPELRGLRFRGDLYAVDFSQAPDDAAVGQGRFLLGRGRKAEAVVSFAAAAQAGNVDAAIEFAWIAATSVEDELRDKARSLRWAKYAVEIRPDSVPARRALAAAFAENGRFAEANGAIYYAMQLAEEQGARDALGGLSRQATVYQSGRPWRE